VPNIPSHVEVYARTSYHLHVSWRAPRSNGSKVRRYEVQRRRLKGKYDLGMPSDNEVELMRDHGMEKSRRRVEGKMQGFLELEWQTIFTVEDASAATPPPEADSLFDGDAIQYVGRPITLSLIQREYGRAIDTAAIAPVPVADRRRRRRRERQRARQRAEAALGRNGAILLALRQAASAGAGDGSQSDGADGDNSGDDSGDGGASSSDDGGVHMQAVMTATTASTGAGVPVDGDSHAADTIVGQAGMIRDGGERAALALAGRPGMSRPQSRFVCSDGLLPHSTHEFRVRAENDVGWSEWSEVSAAAKTRTARPFLPSQPHLFSGPMEPITLRWFKSRNNGCPVQGYELWEQDLDGGGSGNGETEEPQWRLTSAVPGHMCTHRMELYQASVKQRSSGAIIRRMYCVRAVNAHGWSDFSEVSYPVIIARDGLDDS
jgi:hypothetical protein